MSSKILEDEFPSPREYCLENSSCLWGLGGLGANALLLARSVPV